MSLREARDYLLALVADWTSVFANKAVPVGTDVLLIQDSADDSVKNILISDLPAAAPADHAASHTDGSDDIQEATAGQKGLMSLAYAGKLDGIEAGAEVNNISDVNATDLTDGGATTLHKHDHGGMDGLADDDHGQYHNDTRGDARYPLKTAKQSKSFIITAPTVAATSSGPVWRVPYAITITNVHVLCVGGTSIIGQLWEYDTNGLNGSVVDASDITGTAGNNVDDDGALSNPGIASGNYLGWRTSTINGAPTKVIITFEYTID